MPLKKYDKTEWVFYQPLFHTPKLLHESAMMMEAASTFVTYINFYKTSQ
jgi:hypothetical protein